jgi:hypothetical protein
MKCEQGTSIFKSNVIPKGVASLEKIFDLQDRFKRITNDNTNSSTLIHQIINLGTI